MAFSDVLKTWTLICGVACSEPSRFEAIKNSRSNPSSHIPFDRRLLSNPEVSDLFGELYEQSGNPDADYLAAVIEAADELLPLAMVCLSREGAHFDFGESGHPEPRWVERNRMRGALLFRMLREKAGSVVPDLIELIEDGSYWDGRHEVACAFNFMGPSGSAVIPFALRDLDSHNTKIRQNALRILGGVGGRSVEALEALKRFATGRDFDESNEAVWGMKMIMDDADSNPHMAIEAREFLVALVTTKGCELSCGPSCVKFALGFDVDATTETILEWVAKGVLDPQSPNYQSHRRKTSGPESMRLY